MRAFWTRPLMWFAAVAVLPACWAVAAALVRTLPAAFLDASGGSGGWFLVPHGWAFIGGVALYLVWHRLRPPEFLYTFIHELTHLIFAYLFGKRVSRFVVSKQGGQVTMSGTNFLITLAPYFFPLLPALVLAGGVILEWSVGDDRFRPAVAFLAGFSLAFHGVMTLRTLSISQPDIARSGKIFSWPVICFFGILFSGSVIFVAAGGDAFGLFMSRLVQESLAAYAWSAGRATEWGRLGAAAVFSK